MRIGWPRQIFGWISSSMAKFSKSFTMFGEIHLKFFQFWCFLFCHFEVFFVSLNQCFLVFNLQNHLFIPSYGLQNENFKRKERWREKMIFSHYTLILPHWIHQSPQTKWNKILLLPFCQSVKGGTEKFWEASKEK